METLVNVELTLAANTVRRALAVGPVVIGLFWVTRGAAGAVAAIVALAIVVGNFLLAGAILSVAARISLGLYHAAALFGFFLRLGLITLTMLVVVRLVQLDRLAFGIAAVVAYMVLLAWETVAVARGRERELEWID